MKKAVWALLIISLVFGLTACSPKQTELSETARNKYIIDIDVAEDLRSAVIHESILFNNTTGTDLNEIRLRVYPEAYRKDSAACAYFTKLQQYGGIDIAKVTADGNELSFAVEGSYLICSLSAPLPKDMQLTLTIQSLLIIPECNLRLGLYGGVLSLANFYPILCVFENGSWRTDEYSKTGDPFVQDCADYDVAMTCSSKLVVASSGNIVSQNDISENRKLYKIEGKMLRDFAVMASENFRMAEALAGNTIIRYYYCGDLRREKEINAARCAVESFGQMMGKYPYDVFSIVERDFYYNGDGFGNLAVISKTAESKENVIIKETAHQWLRGIAASDPIADPWQNEALGTFLQAYYFYLNGDKNAYDACRDSVRKEYISFQNARQKSQPGSNFCLERPLSGYITNYEYGMIAGKKGFLMFDAVFQTLGKDKMNKVLKSYYETYAYKRASAQDMFAVFDKASRQDVSGIMQSWLEEKTLIAGIIVLSTPQET